MENQEKTNKEKFAKEFGKFHDKYYKLLLLIPAIILVISLLYLFNFYKVNNDFIHKDISLTGGTTITIYEKLDPIKLKLDLSSKLEDLDTSQIYDLITQEQKAVVIETKSSSDDSKKILEEYLGFELNEDNSSFEFTESALSGNFYNQLLIAMLISFVLMSLVIFVIFRSLAPSMAVIVSAFADIVMTVALVNFLGIQVSSAGIVAFLMLIGYSVDTDILLTNRVLKGDNETLNKKIFGAFKTGMTMTTTAIFSVVSALVVIHSFSSVLSQIFTIITIGLCFDVLNTWVTNVCLLKWYVKSKEKNQK